MRGRCSTESFAVDNMVGKQMRRARRDSGLRFDEFVRRVGYSASDIRNVEGGSRPVTPEMAAAYDRVLATGGRFRDGFAGRGAEPWDQSGNIAALVQLLDRNDVELDRRSVVTGAAMAVGGATVQWLSALRSARTGETRSSPRQVGTA